MTGQNVVDAGTRLASMILDHFIMTMVAMLFAIPMMINIFSGVFTISHEQNEMDFGGPFFYVSLLGSALYFCKDIINGQSIGKRITKTQVVDNNTMFVASPMKCFLRNITCVIWPLEVLLTLITPDRRLGDLLAGTRVIPFDYTDVRSKNFNLIKVLPPIALSYGIMLLVSLPFQLLKPKFPSTNYIDSSYNASESRLLENTFADSLENNTLVSVKIFDKIENNDGKYISIICICKDTYSDRKEKVSQINKLTSIILNTRYSEGGFTSNLQCVYKTNSSTNTTGYQVGKK